MSTERLYQRMLYHRLCQRLCQRLYQRLYHRLCHRRHEERREDGRELDGNEVARRREAHGNTGIHEGKELHDCTVIGDCIRFQFFLDQEKDVTLGFAERLVAHRVPLESLPKKKGVTLVFLIFLFVLEVPHIVSATSST